MKVRHTNSDSRTPSWTWAEQLHKTLGRCKNKVAFNFARQQAQVSGGNARIFGVCAAAQRSAPQFFCFDLQAAGNLPAVFGSHFHWPQWRPTRTHLCADTQRGLGASPRGEAALSAPSPGRWLRRCPQITSLTLIFAPTQSPPPSCDHHFFITGNDMEKRKKATAQKLKFTE